MIEFKPKNPYTSVESAWINIAFEDYEKTTPPLHYLEKIAYEHNKIFTKRSAQAIWKHFRRLCPNRKNILRMGNIRYQKGNSEGKAKVKKGKSQ